MDEALDEDTINKINKIVIENGLDSNEFIDKTIKIHYKVYSYVNKHGNDSEWKSKWGNKY